MGSGESKANQPTGQSFSQDERQTLSSALLKLSNGKDLIPLITVQDHVSKHLNNDIGKKFTSLLSKENSNNVSVPCRQLINTLGPLIKGTPDDIASVIMLLAGGTTAEVDNEDLIQLVCLLLQLYIDLCKDDKTSKVWQSCDSQHATKVAQCLLRDLNFPQNNNIKEIWGKPHPKFKISSDSFEKWLSGNSLFSQIYREVLRNCFPYAPSDASANLLPQLTFLPKKSTRSISSLSSVEVLYLNSCLPASLRSDWRFLFSMDTHGSSFSLFMKEITGKGPTLLVVTDQSGNRYGGFASTSWEIRPQFQGTAESFLFALTPEVGIFHSTGYNNNFMYLNYLEKNTMPNGLGMGGCLELFGFWIDYDFGKGTVSPSCSTFRSPPLSNNEQINIQAIEVWGLGPEEKDSDSDEDEVHGKKKSKSALDSDPGARAMLDMIGRTAHSDGLREPEEAD